MTSGLPQGTVGAAWTAMDAGRAASTQETQEGGWGLVRIANDGSLHPVLLYDGAIVGRADERTPGAVHLDAEGLADQHAQFSVRPDGVYVADLDTPSGTRIDGVPAGMLGVAHGSILRMGEVLAMFVERDLRRYQGQAELIGGEMLVGPRQHKWVDQAKSHVLSHSSFLIGGDPGVGKSLLARVSVRLYGESMATRTIDGGDPKAEEMIAQVAADTPTAWVVPHIERLPRALQSELVRLVRRTTGSMLVATIGGTVEDAQAEGWLGSAVLSLVETRRVEVPSLEERREDIAALALALCSRDGIDSSHVTLDVLEHVTRGGWPGGVQELRILLRVVFDRESQNPLGLPYLRRRIARPSPKIPLPLQAADADLARARLRRALDRASGTVAVAARDLKMSRQSFYRELRRLGMGGGKRPPSDDRTT